MGRRHNCQLRISRATGLAHGLAAEIAEPAGKRLIVEKIARRFSVLIICFQGMIFRYPKTMRLFTKVFPSIVFLLASFHSAEAQWRPLGDVTAVQRLENGVEVSAGSAHVRVAALGPNVIRVQYAPQGSFPADHSFAVVPNAFPEGGNAKVQDNSDAVVVDTGSLRAQIFKSATRIAFLDPN